ncbi:MAG: yiaD 1 [Gammaproteobacteria bacterium]|jgi:outer membrane protein OmpA-like peptidoglycan-associated protein|nr:yiaD 1 [Gammaproteobacteria bacterium]
MIDIFTLRLTFISLLSFSLSACSYNPFNGSDHLTGSALGTGAGAIAGGSAAAVMGTSSKPMLGLAALAGASVGYYITSLRFDSAGIIQAGGQVYTLGDYATIEIPSDKLFDTNSSDLLPQADAILKSVVAILNRYDCNNIMISGNTSGFNSSRFEHRLSEDRARQVAGFLWAHGVSGLKAQSLDSRKLTYVGYGNYFPVANNITNSGIRANSRIQITAYPTKDQLLIDKKQKTFNNIGDIDEPHLPVTSATPNIDAAFAQTSEKLPEEASSRAEDFRDAFPETSLKEASISSNEARSSDYYKEKPYSHSIEESAPQTTVGGNVTKQGGFRGFKGE